ncbi:hypothetical protein F4778DRAFT_714263 [Xylariomycetidae sp. FL2044]|nr:hypothetical protein F4778DRAFT_714263 [Xylariomycetidae sp. FL2044]
MREPHIYGPATLSDVETSAKSQASSPSATLSTFQSNHEGRDHRPGPGGAYGRSGRHRESSSWSGI